MMDLVQSESLVVVDVETTGTNPFKHQVVSLAFVPMDSDRPTLELFIKDGPLTWQSQAKEFFQHVRPEWEQFGQSPEEACKRIRGYVTEEFGQPVTLAGHNVGFDVAFLRQLAFRGGLDELPLVSHRAVDTHTLLYLLYLRGDLPRSALSSSGAFKHFGIVVPSGKRHTAGGDALATRELITRLLPLLLGHERVD